MNLDAAEYMNKYYTDAGPKLSQNYSNIWKETDSLKNINSTFKFDFVHEGWIKKLIKDIKKTKSSAVDNLGSQILKDAFSVLTLELTFLYNCCIENGIFPVSWSVGKITPIPKTSNISTEAKNWRPITQIPLPGKILERVMHSQIYNYFDNNLLYENRYGENVYRMYLRRLFKSVRDNRS